MKTTFKKFYARLVNKWLAYNMKKGSKLKKLTHKRARQYNNSKDLDLKDNNRKTNEY